MTFLPLTITGLPTKCFMILCYILIFYKIQKYVMIITLYVSISKPHNPNSNFHISYNNE